jgi:hypothetical protein
MGLFLLYVFASIAWSTEPLDGIYRLWEFTLIAGCFWLGSVREPKPILIGLAYGYLISSVLALGQLLGVDSVLRYNLSSFAGLHFSNPFAGAIGAMLIVALASERLWLLSAACIPGLCICGSRGGIAAALVGIASIWVRRSWFIPLACAGAVAFVFLSGHNSDIERLAIWKGSASLLTPFGHGAGSYIDLFITSPFGITRAEHAHNDLLQILFETGIGATPLLAVWITLSLLPANKFWPVIACFTVLGVYFFPLYTPLSAAIFALCAGASVRDWSSAGDLLGRLRHLSLSRQANSPVSPLLST